MRSPRFLAMALALCLALPFGLTACGDDEEGLVTVDVAQLCADSLQAMHSQGCVEAAYQGVDELKDCLAACGPENEACQEACFAGQGTGFSSCSGDVEFLFSGACGDCYDACGSDFAGDGSEPGCLFDPNPDRTGTECLDELYDCVEAC